MKTELSRQANKNELIEAIGKAVMRWQDAVETFDETFGRKHDLNSSDRRCLSLLSMGPQPAVAIAKATSRTAASVTSLIDRLAARGLVARRTDSMDRRKVMVGATPKAMRLIESGYGPIRKKGADMLAPYSCADLAVVNRFINDAIRLQQRISEEVLGSE